jgi:hypothetical protein
MKFDNEKKVATEIVSQISLKLVFPKLLAKSKCTNHSTNKDMLLRKVYSGSYLNFSYSWLHFNIILAFQWLLSKRFPHQTAKTSRLCYTEVAERHITI